MINVEISRCVPLPRGYKLAVCPICGSIHLNMDEELKSKRRNKYINLKSINFSPLEIM